MSHEALTLRGVGAFCVSNARNLARDSAENARMTWLKVDSGRLSLLVKIDAAKGRVVGAWLAVGRLLLVDVRVGRA